jgi:hypothetical protein
MYHTTILIASKLAKIFCRHRDKSNTDAEKRLLNLPTYKANKNFSNYI